MIRRIVTAVGFFSLLFLPIFALSFWAYTVFHQIILLVGFIVAVWVSSYLSNLVQERGRLSRELFTHLYELKGAKEALASCLATETKTQAYNRRLLESRLSEECNRARRYERPLSFLLIEIDTFKDIEKNYGTSVSQALIQEVADFLRVNTRAVDILVRQGEDRIVAILPETRWDQTRTVAERICYSIEKNSFRVNGNTVKITVSIGFIGHFDSSVYRSNLDVMDTLERAISAARKGGPGRIATLASP